ncbi:signal peptide peptidase SppA [Acanthopleuribacter pedis]|uniref:Signal peptide peptidase SppA n=1 Tax=Acanthopleuribacter pedis TaxID=442870 RepID=A0A8J7QBT0_9BACT|nr:signal peptide peptidase SppA [Acanthopleuribacter pedis]MBO1320809.1 signal peptide peptidase SppA [Acanthopleuribacter pedis]
MKNFLGQVLAVLVAFTIIGSVGGLFVAIGVAVGGGSDGIKDKSLLKLNMSLPIVDKPISNDVGEAVREIAKGNEPPEGITLRTVLDSIEYAATDDRIAGIYLTGNAGGGMRTGWANFAEVRRALIEFKASGKKIYAYNENYGERDYYLASVADNLYLNKFGFMELNGFAADMMFFKKAFEKYGVNAQVTRVGKYKSAVEPYLLDKMSDANREQITTLLNDLMTAFIDGVVESRGLTAEELNQIAQEKGVLMSDAAVEAKLFDAARDYDEVLDELREVTGTEPGKKIENVLGFGKYHAAIADKIKKSSKEKIAVVYAEGTIVDGESKKNVGGRTVARLLRKAREDKDVKAVVLRVNSPGGSAQASELILREVRLTKAEKPIVVSMGSLAASGGYWISAYADEIIAEPNTITGSIGVFGLFFNFGELMTEHGVTTDVAATHNYAATGSAYRAMSQEELDFMQDIIDFIYEGFLDRVSEGRNLPREQVAEIAQGRVWSGARAKELGLVDQLGGLEDALAAAAKRAELEAYQIEQFQKEMTPMENLMEKMGMNTMVQTESRAETDLRRMISEAEALLKTYNDPRGVYARLPYELEID